jgi:hypothetical protein
VIGLREKRFLDPRWHDKRSAMILLECILEIPPGFRLTHDAMHQNLSLIVMFALNERVGDLSTSENAVMVFLVTCNYPFDRVTLDGDLGKT